MTQTQQQFDFVKMVANLLAENFVQPLFELTEKKDYPTRIGGLAEIIDWAKEFHDQYYDKIIDWNAFQQSKDNIYNAKTFMDLIIVFGQEKLKIFYNKNANHSTYFLEKYSTVTKNDYQEEFYYS